MKDKIYENDLYQPVKEYFESLGYTVKAEVKDCDVVAIKDDELVIAELKLNLNLDVILQATIRKRMTEKVYIAVPVPKKYFSKRFKNICYLLKRLEIGLILVYIKKNISYVRMEHDCTSFNVKASSAHGRKKKKVLEREFHQRHGDNNIGGVNREKLVTVYRERSLYIAGLLNIHGALSAKQLKELGADKNAYVILYNNHYGWFEKESKGIYKLSEAGLNEIKNYTELVDTLLNEEGV